MATSSTAGAGGAIVIPRAPECATPPMPGPGDIPCNVFDVIHRRCNVCHQGPPQLNGAPFPLLNYQDVDTCYGTMYRRWAVMLDAINPSPMLATPMPFGGPPLDAADLKTMNDWLTGGAVPDASGTGCGCKEGWPMVTGGNGCN